MSLSFHKIRISKECTGCANCFLICPNNAIRINDKASVNASLCDMCGKCYYVCPKSAIEISGGHFSKYPSFQNRPGDTKLYDMIIIGSGIGGLLTAAYLSKVDKKVIILEKLSLVGGRFSSIPYKGFQISTGAVHMVPHGSKGPFATMLNHLSIDFKVYNSDVFASFCINGQHYVARKMLNLISLFSFWEKIELFKLAMRMKRTKFLGASLSFWDWLRKQTKSKKIATLFEALSNIALGVSIKDVSYNEMRKVMKNVRKLGVPGVIKGGCGDILNKLRNFAETRGSNIRINTEVIEILTRDGKAYGVTAWNRETGRTEEIKSNIIISDIGPETTNSLLRKSIFSPRDTQKLKEIKRAEALKIHFSSSKSLISHNGIMFSLDTQRITGIVQPTNADPQLAPKGKHLLIAYQILRSRNNREEIRIALNDLRHIFGKDFEHDCKILSVSIFRDEWPVNRVIQGADFECTTLIEGLYLVGDGCKASGYAMVEGVAQGVKSVLNKLGVSSSATLGSTK